MARPKQSDYDPETNLTHRESKAIECLLTREPEETLAQVAERAGVKVRVLYRYMRDADFKKAYKERVELEMGGHRSRVANALVKGAVKDGPGQAAMQKIYWQRLGELNEKVELTGANGGPVESLSTQVKVDLSELSVEEKVAMAELIEKLGIKPVKPNE